MEKADIGLIGLGVMGQNLALNLADKGWKVVVWNRTVPGKEENVVDNFIANRAKGKGIIMISSELPELIGICDRIYVVSEGRIAGMLSRSEFSQESIMQLAVSNMEHTEEVASK